jgi:hypothetical protein
VEKYGRKIKIKKEITAIDSDDDGVNDAIVFLNKKDLYIPIVLKQSIKDLGMYTDYEEPNIVPEVISDWDTTNDGFNDGFVGGIGSGSGSGSGGGQEICVNFIAYQFQSLFISGTVFNIGAAYQTLCGETNLVGDDYYFYAKLSNPSQLDMLQECNMYNFGPNVYQSLITNFSQLTSIYEGVQNFNNGFSAKLLKKGLVSGNGIALFSLKINEPYFLVMGYQTNEVSLNFNACTII